VTDRPAGTPAWWAWRRDAEHRLHTSVEQRLAALALDLRTGDTADRVRWLADLDAVTAEVRDLARALYPATLRHGGLAAALRALRRRADTVVDLQVGDLGEVEPEVALAVHDVVRLALTGRAVRPLRVAVTRTDDVLTLVLTGVDHVHPDAAPGVAALGGRMQPVEGAGVVVRLPLAAATTVPDARPLAG
jgi:hypothetical protein